jgi:AraC-like DNA-binding protein
MVCPRCIDTVNRIAESAGLISGEVKLGEITIDPKPQKPQLNFFNKQLKENGFEIVKRKKAREINKIKTLIIKRIHYQQEHSDLKLSAYLSRNLNSEYSRLSKLFSSMEGITIERFATLQRIEKIKELLVYDQLTVTEIADQLDYSSPAHLSAQFKRETGMSPSEFKELRNPSRKSLDSL